MVSRLKRHDPYTVASDRVSTLVVSLPNFKLEFGPAANRLTLIVEVKGMIPHCKLINLVSDLLISLSSVLSIDEGPVKSTFDLELAESS